MAKPIPKKKAKVEKPTKKKENPKVKKRLAEIQDKVDERYAWAHALYKAQPEDVQQAVRQMTKTMGRMAGPPRFVMDGHTFQVNESVLLEIQKRSHLWIAMRMIVACAEWGIRIGNFKAPKKECLRCGKPVKAKKKGKKK